jgi:TolB-like protein/tetratricopeptide (TPR) repeat protein
MSWESWSHSDQKLVREQLDRILDSGPFLQSRRRQRFLEYVVSETLAGRGDRLKGYNIAREVFDRPEEFDPNVDPIVRMEAARLRDRLREYYDADGRDDPIRIELPKGGYKPQIEFRHDVPAVDHASVATRDTPWWKRRQTGLLFIAPTLLLAAIGLWLADSLWRSQPRELTPTSTRSSTDVPAIAVLPFVNLSSDPKEEYFSDGLTEDILTELSRARDLRVLARNTTFQFKGKAVDVSRLGQELRARYVLEGSARRTNDRLRVTAQLIDTETGVHIWADRYDRDMADIALVQDEIVNQIVAKIAGSYGAIERNEAKAAARKTPKQLQAYDLILRARDIIQWDWTSENFSAARAALNQATALDPTNAQARRELAWLAVTGWVFRLDETPVPPEDIAEQAAKAVELDPADARSRMAAASAYFFTKQLDRFTREAEQALVLAPFDAEIMATLACMFSAIGDHTRGVALAEKANALNPDAATGWYHSTLYTANYLKGDYERALKVARQNQDAEMFYSYLEIIPIFGQLGLKQEALDAWKKLQAQLPDASANTFEDWWRLWNMPEADIVKLMEGVHKSGVLGAEG